ncbi:MAG: hypothetical protein A3F54_02220 [Candidatus Kerfeldbacteria bacterium RIFCSPHIGHO2_12_FULL_48_17]|uniref:Transcription regulator TrmB N-terminal domain-containing protein n=1 Tax=Candidatus Kerfeldbacteria bacterium RIFCSPHIGHO2_12_FULL_48_17 TaxID=1798542 RepID=A0A1G2AZJ4_9BACT|nr:MAG: hypothetical protein A3F54_02220 [Candidatus Kerfeldbacteria bacterium RIFCSPHIGHO2_12_FULL_48_17]
MNQALIQQLQTFDLSEGEARVYLALFELGSSVVTPIAEQAHIHRTTCYNFLESLVAKKLVSRTNYRGKQSYTAEQPAKFHELIAKEKEHLKELMHEVRLLRDGLTKIYTKRTKKPVIKYVEGWSGIIELYEESLRCRDTEGIRSYTSFRDLKKEIPEYLYKYIQKRTSRHIHLRAIVPDSDYGEEARREQDQYFREIRLVPREKFDFSPEIYMYENKLALMSLREKFGMVVESEEIVEALKKTWELAWKRAAFYDVRKDNN